MSRTDVVCRNSGCPADKARARLTDSGGLYLEVTPDGSRRRFSKYRFVLRAGTDPAQQRQLDKLTRQTVAGITFEAVDHAIADRRDRQDLRHAEHALVTALLTGPKRVA